LILAIAIAVAVDPSVVVEKNVEARMRDGVVLRADVYRPEVPGRYPALLQRTPYSKNSEGAADTFRSIASRGFAVVVQDTRGRYTSDGIARPHDEFEDGFDTVEWVARLPYVNGRVGMFGGSYLATTQLTAASLRPPHLVAIFPSASYANRYDMVYPGGAFYLGDGLSWNLGQAADVRRRLVTPDVSRDGPIGLSEVEQKLLRERWYWHAPLATMDALELRRFHPAYFEMLQHPSYDAYWKRFDLAARHSEFEVPALHLTGWYDSLLNGTLGNFSGLARSSRTETARRSQRLVVGPWTHARPTRRSTKVADVDFGPEAGLDSQGLMLEWFTCWFQGTTAVSSSDRGGAGSVPPGHEGRDFGEPRRSLRRRREAPSPTLMSPHERIDPCALLATPRVRLFVMGENRWRDENEWPLARAKPTSFYMGSNGSAETLRGDGALTLTPPAPSVTDRFLYDPWNPVPTGEAGAYSRAPRDQKWVEERTDVLVYTSAPLTAPIEVTGPVELVLWISSTAPDTDFTGKLVDVDPEGAARLLTDGILRARYRKSKSTPELLTPGEPTEIHVELGATSNLFRIGHRIRLEVSSSNFPRYDRNPNTGRPVADEVRLERAEQTIFHDPNRPSRLVLPVVPR